MGPWLGRVAEIPIEVVFPRRCAGCGRRGVWLCTGCDAAFARFAPPWCARCGLPVPAYACRCDTLPPSLDAVRALGPYAGWLREAIIGFKYHGERARAAHLADPLVPLLAGFAAVDALVPVPLHVRRRRERGFNQSRELAVVIGRRSGVPVLEVLARERATAQQVGLTEEGRRQNVAGAFSVPEAESIRARSLVLIDDVVTTGATLGACAEALRAAGAARVGAIVLARDL